MDRYNGTPLTVVTIPACADFWQMAGDSRRSRGTDQKPERHERNADVFPSVNGFTENDGDNYQRANSQKLEASFEVSFVLSQLQF